MAPTKKEFMKMSTNIESDNIDTTLELDKLNIDYSFMLDHAKEQDYFFYKCDELEIIPGKKSTVSFDTSI